MQITIREPGSAITHFIAMMMAVFASTPFINQSCHHIRLAEFYSNVNLYVKYDPIIWSKCNLS